MNKYHLKIVRKSSEHRSVGFEVNISNGNCAVTQKAKLPLHVQLLEEEDAVADGIHGVSESKRARCSPLKEITELPKPHVWVSHHP